MYKINLLPPELRKKPGIDVKQFLLVLFYAAMLTSVLWSYGQFLFHLYGLRAEINGIDDRLAQISPRVAAVEQLKRERLEGEKTIKAYRDIIESRFVFTDMLDEIARNMPVDMWLTDISLENRVEYTGGGGFASPPGVPDVLDETGDRVGVTAGREAVGEMTADRGADGEPGEASTEPNKNDGSESSEAILTPNLLVLRGVAYTPASVGVLVSNLAKLPYIANVDVRNVYAYKREDVAGQAFAIEARLREVQNAAKP